MKATIVSIASDQTIPNVLFLKQFREQATDCVFVTTEKMKKKKVVLNTCIAVGIDYATVKEIEVVETSMTNMETVLQKHFPYNDSTYLVNMTGGTKLMSLAVYNFFKEKKSLIYYKDVSENFFRQIYPDNEQILAVSELSVEEFLQAYGADRETIKKGETPEHSEIVEKLYERIMEKNITKPAMRKEIFESICNEKGMNISKEKNYFSGVWFEEYVYSRIQGLLKIEDPMISINVKLRKNNELSENEYDVMFVYKNTLYVVECKSGSVQSFNSGKNSFQSIVYKITALKQNFGLVPKMFLAVNADLSAKIHEDKRKRAKTHGITLLDKNIIGDGLLFEEVLKGTKKLP